ncbi:MAG: hypothetical protein ACJ0BO_05255 [Candidatus Puniceispirillaceae bacterium]
MSANLEGRFIAETNKAPRGITATTLLLFAICLCSCLPERFRHEKYDCSGSLQNINTIIINKAKTGNYAKIVSPTSETKAKIIQIDEKTAWLTHKNMQMKINRKTGTMTLVQGTKYIKIGCKKTVFKM